MVNIDSRRTKSLKKKGNKNKVLKQRRKRWDVRKKWNIEKI